LTYEVSRLKHECDRSGEQHRHALEEHDSLLAKTKKQSKVIDKLCARMRLTSELLA